jgi:hypothetical protein
MIKNPLPVYSAGDFCFLAIGGVLVNTRQASLG